MNKQKIKRVETLLRNKFPTPKFHIIYIERDEGMTETDIDDAIQKERDKLYARFGDEMRGSQIRIYVYSKVEKPANAGTSAFVD